MRFGELYQKQQEKQLTIEESAEVLGVSERIFRRYAQKYDGQGAEGLVDKRLDRLANNAAPVDEVMDLISLFETRYRTWTVAHFYEKYQEEHGGSRSYTWVKNQLRKSVGPIGLNDQGNQW